MAEVALSIGGRPHRIACRDGEEARLRMLGQMVDERYVSATRVSGGNPERAMLLAALMLADDLDEVERRPPPGAAVTEDALARIADRLESLAAALEQTPAAS